ncbi:MAG: hypothetical protein GTN49_03925 [candidate division Zixibacteria bacterium]|nr:hypothetical protein [candidate division Zixibacteria bacterium]
MDGDDELRRGRGCFVTAIAVAGTVAALVVLALLWVNRAANDPASRGYRLLQVVRGEKPAEEWVTEVIIGRLAKKADLPPEQVAALERELGPISRDLPWLSEGEKHKLAALIQASIEDGRLTDDEIAAIREYSYRSARDGNAKP